MSLEQIVEQLHVQLVIFDNQDLFGHDLQHVGDALPVVCTYFIVLVEPR